MDGYDLSGRSALVTGASRGLGLSIAKALAASGAEVFLSSQSPEDLERAAKEVKKEALKPNQKIFHLATDISKPQNVSKLIEAALEAFAGLTILVSNAGVYGTMGKIEDVAWGEFTKAIEINLYGPILLARALAPHFRKQGYGKIIQLSGGGATNPLPRLESYAASKAAVVRFMESLALDLAQFHVDVNSIAPGLLDTRMLDQILEAGPEAVGQAYHQRMLEARGANKCVSLAVPTKLAIFLASKASDGITGKLISAVWDDYEDWPNHIEQLNKSDLYTLRRITGRDRNSGWGDK
ncbi:MAG: SDR family oxidoreductase [Deltaproteobacteria bacterium]|jgi:NAD(P)-dependent dehydrogenase (short-subunit alcohol dehydrogenase family)|nr:SDR family oxidoreductase [Deltaproteobacteria bacterium]